MTFAAKASQSIPGELLANLLSVSILEGPAAPNEIMRGQAIPPLEERSGLFQKITHYTELLNRPMWDSVGGISLISSNREPIVVSRLSRGSDTASALPLGLCLLVDPDQASLPS